MGIEKRSGEGDGVGVGEEKAACVGRAWECVSNGRESARRARGCARLRPPLGASGGS